jgi:hypothetical protein
LPRNAEWTGLEADPRRCRASATGLQSADPGDRDRRSAGPRRLSDGCEEEGVEGYRRIDRLSRECRTGQDRDSEWRIWREGEEKCRVERGRCAQTWSVPSSSGTSHP